MFKSLFTFCSNLLKKKNMIEFINAFIGTKNLDTTNIK